MLRAANGAPVAALFDHPNIDGHAPDAEHDTPWFYVHAPKEGYSYYDNCALNFATPQDRKAFEAVLR